GPPPRGPTAPPRGTPRVSRWRLPKITTAAMATVTATAAGDQAVGATSMCPRTGGAAPRRGAGPPAPRPPRRPPRPPPAARPPPARADAAAPLDPQPPEAGPDQARHLEP